MPLRRWDVGELVADRWEVTGEASGGIGPLTFVRDREWDGMPLAVRSFAGGEGSVEEQAHAARRFGRSALAWLTLPPHPSVIAARYALEVDGARRLFLEYAPGRWLGEVLAATPSRLPLARAATIMRHVAAALEHAHAAGVVHEDLRADCCLLGADDEVRVADFGTGGPGVAHPAPERWRGALASPAADVYAFGCVLYQLLVGETPFAPSEALWGHGFARLSPALRPRTPVAAWPRGDLRALAMRMHLGVAPVPPRELGLDVPPALERLVLACLDKTAARRPTWRFLRDRLDGIAAELGGSATALPTLVLSLAPAIADDNNRAVSAYHLDRVELAEGLLDGALARQPDALVAWSNRKTIALHRGETDPAALAAAWDALVRSLGPAGLDGQRAAIELGLRAGVVPFVQTAPVRHVAIAPDGRHLAIGTSDGAVRVWSTTTWHAVEIERQRAPLRGLELHASGELVLTHTDESVRLWDVKRGLLARSFARPDVSSRRILDEPGGRASWVEGGARDFSFARLSPDGRWLLTRSDGPVQLHYELDSGARVIRNGGGVAALWEVATGRLAATLEGGDLLVADAAFTPDGRALLTVGADPTLWLWDVASGKLTGALAAGTGWLDLVAVSADGMLALTCAEGADERVAWIWDLEARELVQALGHAAGDIRGAFHPDGSVVTVAGGEVEVHDPRSGRPLRTIAGAHSLTRDARWALTLGESGGSLWEVATGRLARTLPGHAAAVLDITSSSDGTWLLTGGEDGCARLWTTRAPEPPPPAWPLALEAPVPTVERLRREAEKAALLARLAVLDLGAMVPLERLRREAPSLRRDEALVRGVHAACAPRAIRRSVRDVWVARDPGDAWLAGARASGDGKRAVRVDGDGVAEVRDVASGRVLGRLRVGRAIAAPSLGSDGRWLLSAGEGGRLDVWDVELGAPLATAWQPWLVPRCLALTSRGVALAGGQGGLALWRVGVSEPRRLDEKSAIQAIAVSADGRLVATGRAYGWTSLTRDGGEPIASLRVFHASSLAFSPDGRYLLVGGLSDFDLDDAEAVVSLFAVGSEQPIETFATGARRFSGVVEFSADGRLALCGRRVWELATGRLINIGGTVDAEPEGFAPGGLYLRGRPWVLDGDWAFLDEALLEAERVLDGAPRSPLWPAHAGPRSIDALCDVWRDLRRAAAHPELSSKLDRALRLVRARLVAALVERVGRAVPFPSRADDPGDPRALLLHPLYRVGLVDPRLAAEVADHLGWDAQAVLDFGWVP